MAVWDKHVVIRKTLSEMVKERDNAVRLWADGYKLLQRAKEICVATARYGGPQTYQTAGPEEATKTIDAAYWRSSFERTGMTQIMDATATKQFHDSLEKKPPVFSMENIESQYLAMYQDADMMFKRGVYRVFAQLDYSYKTNANEPYEISAKNILGYMFDNWSGHPSLQYHKSDMINDIDRVVKVVTGRKHEPRQLETNINAAMKEEPWIFEDDDYQVKGFKNGNAHLLFKNAGIVRMINAEIAAYCNFNQIPEAA